MTIMLGEPLITKDTWRTDLARMSLTAIRASLSLLYDITATSFDCMFRSVTELIRSNFTTPRLCILLGSSIGCIMPIHRRRERDWRYCVCRSIPIRSTGLQVRASLEKGTDDRMAMSQYAERYPVGQRQIKMLDETLENTTAGLSHPDMFK
jgi:hypothetical protein